ncbi:MAG: hypothetical protein NWE92_00190 [Candidatus Bathyarchaeota archaeon]|nr:hypothetical protein [Candidatus Bathyarchaeota archaeon]
MRLEEVFNKTERNFEQVLRKRFTCAHCGKTWVELKGLFSKKKEGQEDIYIQASPESEVCQHCKFRTQSCPACHSTDVYEITFPSDDTQDTPLSFDRIRIVSKS